MVNKQHDSQFPNFYLLKANTSKVSKPRVAQNKTHGWSCPRSYLQIKAEQYAGNWRKPRPERSEVRGASQVNQFNSKAQGQSQESFQAMSPSAVSRAGQKLAFALDTFGISVDGKICADLGCGTGGFTQCLLERGAQKVYAVDTGYGDFAWELRTNPKVILKERTNALHVVFTEKLDLITIDVGWTPQKLIIPKALSLLADTGDIISLLKPHYESPDRWLKKGAVPEEHLKDIVDKIQEELSKLGIPINQIVQSPITGKKGGNVEYLLWIKHP